MLQMTVLPYIILSLTINLGRITWAESRGLLLTLIAVFSIFLILGAVVLLLSPIAFSPMESASFFKTSPVAPPPVMDLIGLYVPSNPFAAMANNLVPAVVLFSTFVGTGLSSVPGSGHLLDTLDVLVEALNKVNKLMIQLTPYGVFFIAASTAGTLSMEEVIRLPGFIIIRVVLGGMHLIVTTVIVLAIGRGVFQPNWRKLATATAVSFVSLLVVLLGTRAYLTSATTGEYQGYDQRLSIQIND